MTDDELRKWAMNPARLIFNEYAIKWYADYFGITPKRLKEALEEEKARRKMAKRLNNGTT